MAEISKLSGVAIADVAKVDAILKASIANINDLTIPSAAAFLLDTYSNAAAAYSVRRLATATTVLLRVRRDTGGATGDDDEADVAYDSNNELSLDSAISNASTGVTATTLGQFINVGTVGGTTYTNPDSLTVTASCYADTWYDQAGSNDVEQATHANQPQIHSGTVDTDILQLNAKPRLDFGSNRSMHKESGISFSVGACASFAVGKKYDQSSFYGAWMFRIGDGSTRQNAFVNMLHTNNDRSQYQLYREESNTGYSVTSDSNDVFNQFLSSALVTSSQLQNYLNGSSLNTTSHTPSTISLTSVNIGGQFSGAGGTPYQGDIQELVFFNADQSSNRSGIESDINGYYLIGNFPNPTSGLLATYTGAAAAYSVRQLANTAALAMRIREDGTDTETDIGFDSNGDLDTAAISSHCGSNNGYVVTWYDQSGEQNDAAQGTSGSQPKLYDATTGLITENGKPALDFDALNDTLNISYTSTFTNISAWSVHAGTTGNVLTSYPGGAPKNFFGVTMTNSQYRSVVRNAAATLKQVLTGTTSDVQVLQHYHYDRTNLGVAIDGATLQTIAAALGDIGTSSLGLRIGASPNNAGYIDGTVQEVLLWNSDEASNRTGIETNINNYFSIY